MSPNWHPVFVHFTIALLFVSALSFLAARMFVAKAWAAELLTVSVTTLARDLRETGDLAVVTSRTRSTGSHDGRAADLAGTETAVLVRGEDGWRIVHLHWSSREGGG